MSLLCNARCRPHRGICNLNEGHDGYHQSGFCLWKRSDDEYVETDSEAARFADDMKDDDA